MLRYADQLTAYLCSILNNPQDAEDLMLESFSVILVDKPGIREGCFKAWLFKTARNKAISLWRRILQRNEFSLSEELADTLNGLTGLTAVKEIRPEEKVLEGERNIGLHNAMSRIAPQYREALWLAPVFAAAMAVFFIAVLCTVITFHAVFNVLVSRPGIISWIGSAVPLAILLAGLILLQGKMDFS